MATVAFFPIPFLFVWIDTNKKTIIVEATGTYIRLKKITYLGLLDWNLNKKKMLHSNIIIERKYELTQRITKSATYL